MYFQFARRYFRAKKSVNAVNIIAQLTVGIIAFAAAAQVLVLSVFNGFEDLVKSLYSSFYADVRIEPAKGKTFVLTQAEIDRIVTVPGVDAISLIAEDKALLRNDPEQTVVTLKGVDTNYVRVSGVAQMVSSGDYNIGNADTPGIVVGYGIQNAADISVNPALPPSLVGLVLPKKTPTNDIAEAISEGLPSANGVFSIQQDIDNRYAITNLDFVKQLMGFAANEYTAAEIKLVKTNDAAPIAALQKLLGEKFVVKNRFQQNPGLYSTMTLEKWAIFGVFTLILIIAAFTMISALSILVLEKKKDISVLLSMGMKRSGIQKIFLAEGLILGLLGAGSGILFALLICFLQIKFEFIKLPGGAFLIDHFPVKPKFFDIFLISISAILVSLLASWLPAFRAARNKIELR